LTAHPATTDNETSKTATVPSLEKHIYLASRSARRRDLLKQMGVNFEMLLLREGAGRDADFNESELPGETPREYVVRVARLKAEAGWLRLEQRRLMRHPVLAADTTVALGDTILAKPADREDAVAMLKQLSEQFTMSIPRWRSSSTTR